MRPIATILHMIAAGLLEAVDDRVRSDAKPSGLTGKVGIGVVQDGRAIWWQATFAAEVETRIERYLDADVAAAILLDPAREPILYGDRAMVRRLVERYLQRLSPISIRFPRRGGRR